MPQTIEQRRQLERRRAAAAPHWYPRQQLDQGPRMLRFLKRLRITWWLRTDRGLAYSWARAWRRSADLA